MSRPVDAVIEFLEAEMARGKTHLLLDPEARDGLRELFLKTRSLSQGAVKTPTPPTQAAPTPPTQAGPTPPTQAAPTPPAIRLEETPVTPAKPADPPPLTITGNSKREKLDSLRRQAESWAPARSLGTLRETLVFSAGSPEARLMLVGEAPGYEEERRMEPFAGTAGQKLNDILKAMGLSREEVYISNIVKFRPASRNQSINNRKATPEEMACFMPFVRKEIEIVKPGCIIALGGTAAEGLLGLSDSVTLMRESWHSFEGIPTRVSFHPSNLLGSANHEIKRKVWEDMLAVMAKLGMEISDKQKGFFLPKA